MIGRPPTPLSDRVWSKVAKSESCWLWTGAPNVHGGYGRVRAGTTTKYAHRVVYEMLVGPIPAGLTLDHLCRNPRCVNPLHLEPVSMRDNILRGEGLAAKNARMERCIRGHALVRMARQRGCVECRRVWARNRWRERMAIPKERWRIA